MTEPVLPFNELSDEEYIGYLNGKAEPTDEDVESAWRIEQLVRQYNALIAQMNKIASLGLQHPWQASIALERIQELTKTTVLPDPEARVMQ